jgi:hypothetical protein
MKGREGGREEGNEGRKGRKERKKERKKGTMSSIFFNMVSLAFRILPGICCIGKHLLSE